MSRLRSDHFTAVQFLIYDVIMAGLIRFLYMLQKSSWLDRVGVRTTTISFDTWGSATTTLTHH
jgi:hypothetical protein